MNPPASNSVPAISARGLVKTYDRGAAAVRALRDVSIDIAAGEVTLLRGPSGSGKTTLLSIAGGLLRPDSGRLIIAGADVTGFDEERLAAIRLGRIGFIFQGYNLFPTLKAWQNVAITLDLLGLPADEQRSRAEAMLARVGLSDKIATYPADLSGGQKQRVAIARALASDPKMILADEPTSALDSENGAMIVDLLRGLAKNDGAAVVVVTHDERVVAFADRIVHMEDGRIVADSVSPAQAETAQTMQAATAAESASPAFADWRVAGA